MMRLRKLEPTSHHSGGRTSMSDSSPKMNITTQLRPSNELNTAYICDCLTKSAMAHLQPNSIERYHITPSCYGLVLEALEEQTTLFNATRGNDRQHQMLLHQFLTKEVESVPAGWDGTPPRMIERYIYHVYQNERRSLALEWGGQYLTQLDRREFTDESGTVVCPFSPLDTGLDPPEGFHWEEACARQWIVDHDYTKVDSEGWCYGADFGYIMNNYRNGESVTTAGLRPTRRRRWKRVAVRVTEYPADPTSERLEVTRAKPQRNISSVDNDPPTDEIVVEIYENQRHAVYWGKHLIPHCERGPFSDDAGKNFQDIESVHTAPPPAGYEWVPGDDWEIDTDFIPTDEGGWVYAFDFLAMMRDLKAGKNLSSKTGAFVRRRKWKRRARKVKTTMGDFAKGKVSLMLPEEACVARREVSHMTRKEAFALHREDILLLCKERPNLQSPITIPWNQVSRVDIITPSVVMIGVTVHRYFGEDRDGTEQYRDAEIEICVADCHAEKLCVLLRERIRVKEFRHYVGRLIASGTMTGEVGVYDYYSTDGGDGEEDGMLMSDQDLSLGSQTIMNLEDEIGELDAQIQSVRALTEASANTVALKWAKSESAQLNNIKMRLKIYSAALLSAGLMGPKFEEEEVRAVQRRDVAEAERVFNRANSHGDSVGAAEGMVNNLLLTAEMRIRDTALCGWSHQGAVLEKCLSIIINSYYISIIGVLGKFFDSKEGLMQLRVSVHRDELYCTMLYYGWCDPNISWSVLRGETTDSFDAHTDDHTHVML